MRRERGLVGARGPQYFHTWDNGGGQQETGKQHQSTRTSGVPSAEGRRARAKVRTEGCLLGLGAWKSLVGSGRMGGSQQEGMRAPSRALSHHRGSLA